MRVNPLGRTVAVVDKDGKATQPLSLFSEEVARMAVIIGTGSPEGIVEAIESQLYMDRAGASGSILYIKQVNDITGDRRLGWIAV